MTEPTVRTDAQGYAARVRCCYEDYGHAHDVRLHPDRHRPDRWRCAGCLRAFSTGEVLQAQAFLDAAEADEDCYAYVKPNTSCAYCGHPNHAQCAAAEISKDRAAALWAGRGVQHKLVGLTPGECQTLHHIWERLPGSCSFMDAFQRVRLHGSAVVMAELPIRWTDRWNVER